MSTQEPIQRYIIVVLGPTGAGKTTLAKETIRMLDKGDVNKRSRKRKIKYIKILVDDLVENSIYYKEKIKKIFKDANITRNYTKTDLTKRFVRDKEMVKKFAEAYFTTRKDSTINSNNKNYDTINDDKLNEAIRKGDRYIVIETTGEYIPSWLKCIEQENMRKNNYKIIYSYVGVKVKELVNRNLNRAYESSKLFLENNENPAPRIPDTTVLMSKILKMISTLSDLYQLCQYENTNRECFYNNCGGNYFNMSMDISNLYFFDNNSTSMRLIYNYKRDKDSVSDIDFLKKVLDVYF